MNSPSQPDQELAQRLAAPLLDVLIRAGLILAMAMLCYRVFSPFLPLMVWALILAVTLYPLHQFLASKIGGKQGLAATLLVVVGVVLIVAPTAMLMSSLGDAVQQLVNDVQNNTLKIPAPRPGVEAPMPVILLGALGGMATAGILRLFVGATLLTLGYQIFMGWVAANPNAGQAQAESDAPSAR